MSNTNNIKKMIIFAMIGVMVIIAGYFLTKKVQRDSIPKPDITGKIINNSSYKGVTIEKPARGKITQEEVDDLIRENGSSEGLIIKGVYDVQ